MRRFFPDTAAAEIWAEVQPAFDDLASNSCLEGLGFLVQFLPTVSLSRVLPGSAAAATWRGWAGQWLALWDALPHCKYWTAILMGLYGRLAKHDVNRVIDWPALMPQVGVLPHRPSHCVAPTVSLPLRPFRCVSLSPSLRLPLCRSHCVSR